MDDARRFLRYVTPGLVFIVEAWALLAASAWGQVFSVFNLASQKEAIGVSFALIVTSGGLGYIFSVVHHFLHWTLWSWIHVVTDPRKTILKAVKRNQLEIRDPAKDEAIKPLKLNKRQGWSILVALWHERAESSDMMKGADQRATSLGDLVHNSGTSLVACAFAVLVSSTLQISLLGIRPNVWSVAAPLGLLIIHFRGYWMTARLAQGVIDTILADAIREESHIKGRPVVAYLLAQ